jgi:hypothetical protein
MKFSVEHHFIYITAHVDEHKEQLQYFYKMTEEDLEEITKECLMDLLISVDPTEMSNIYSPEVAQDTPGPSKTKKTKKTKKAEEVQDIGRLSVRMASTKPNQ